MSLQTKILNLKLQGALAVRHAIWWEKQIREHGEEKATAFYKHLGLNHLEAKSFDFEGLTLRREPRETEKIAVKGVHQAQESSKEAVGKILLNLREELISDGLKGITKLDPATYHKLTLQASPESHQSLRDRLIKVHKQGRMLIAAELGKKQDSEDDDEFDELDDLTDVTDSRVANDVQSRIVAAATRFALLGLVGAALMDAIRQEMADGSVGYIDRAASGVSNKVISLGRYQEMKNRADEIETYEQSALLDQNTCGPCAADDGKTASDPDDLPGAPNPDCEGSDYCRDFIVAIASGG